MKNELEVSDLGFTSILLTLKLLILIPIIISISGLPTIIMLDLNKEHKTILSLSGSMMANEKKILEIPIDPLYFKVAQYKIIITVSVNVFVISKKENRDFTLEVVKEGVALGLDVEEGENIYTDHLINFRARLVENDLGPSNSIENGIPISGQVLTFKIGDSDNHQILGTAITGIDGYATFTYRVELAKGLHIFNVSYAGNNVYDSYETYSLFENQGVFTQILLSSEITPVSFNNIGELKAKFDRLYKLKSKIK